MPVQNIESICRQYSFKPVKSTPYNTELAELKSSIETIYRSATTSYETHKQKIKKTVSELDEVASKLNEGIFSEFKGIFSNGNGKKIEKIVEQGNNLLKSKEKLDLLLNSIDECYNKSAEAVYGLSAYIENVREFIEKKKQENKKVGEDIANLYDIHSSPEKLKDYLCRLIEQEKVKGDSPDIEANIISALRERGGKELERLSGLYLEFDNDMPIAEDLISYSVLIEKYNELTASFKNVRERISNEVRRIREVLLLYENISVRELDILSEIGIPKKYEEGVRNLVDGIEKIDQMFSDEALKIIFGKNTRPKVQLPQLDEVVHGLAEHLEKTEKTEEIWGLADGG